MVLHNSKWDKKATHKYNKKHGISGKTGGKAVGKPDDPVQANRGDRSLQGQHRPSNSDDKSERDDSDDSSDLSSPGSQDSSHDPHDYTHDRTQWKPRPLQSNEWRYKEESSDEEDETLSELMKLKLKEVEIKQQEDEEKLQIDYAHMPARPFDLVAHPKRPEKYMEPVDIRKGHVLKHENPAEFKEIQNKIDRAKIKQSIKQRLKVVNGRKKVEGPDTTQAVEFDDFMKEIDQDGEADADKKLSKDLSDDEQSSDVHLSEQSGNVIKASPIGNSTEWLDSLLK